MAPRARMTQRWPLRPWRSQRKMYVVLLIYRGALRRRMRRLVRPRVFNSARTATRNLDLPPAIGGSPSLPSSSYCTGGFWPVHGGHSGGLFWHPPVSRASCSTSLGRRSPILLRPISGTTWFHRRFIVSIIANAVMPLLEGVVRRCCSDCRSGPSGPTHPP